MTDITDQAAAYLAEVRKREQAATPGPWTTTEQHGRDITDEYWSKFSIIAPASRDACGNHGVALLYWTDVIEPDQSEEDGAFITNARADVPRLLAALEAVLGNHAELKDGPFANAGYCPTCWRIWPCETYRVISAALLGETRVSAVASAGTGGPVSSPGPAAIPPQTITATAVAIHDVDCTDDRCSGSALGHCYKLARAALEAARPHLAATERGRCIQIAQEAATKLRDSTTDHAPWLIAADALEILANVLREQP